MLTNIPTTNTVDSTIQAVGSYNSSTVDLDATTFSAMKGYFTNRNFDEVAAESITVVIMTQAKKDGYNPMQILDTLKGLNDVELSGLITEILNYNRFKTSSIGYAAIFKPNPEIARNIIV